MKRLLMIALGCAGLWCGTAVAATCNNSTLVGTVYAAVEKTTASGPAATLYMESWDGAGHLQYLETDSDGYTTTGPYPGTGTYTIGANCVATVYYDGDTSTPWLYYIDQDGKGYSWVNGINIGIVSAGHATLVTSALLVDPLATTPGPCSLASLKGTLTFAVENTKNGQPRASAGFESYDGAGHLKYQQTNSDGTTTSTYTGSGTYTITSRCVASVLYDGATTSPWIYFVAPNGAGYWWVNNQNAGGVSAGVASRVSHGLVVK